MLLEPNGLGNTMTDVDAVMLARLIAQAGDEGATLVTLRALVEEASALGAARALERLGLEDGRARGDIGELRELLGAWRDAKSSAWKAAGAWVMRIVLAAVMLGLAVKMDLIGRIGS